MKLPTAKSLMWPVLEVLQTKDEPASAHEISELVARHMGLSEALRSMLHKDGPKTELHYRVEWALTGLKHAGAVDIPVKGYRIVTDAGRTIDTESELLERYERVKPATLKAWYQDRFGDTQVWVLAAGEGGVLWGDFKKSGIASVGWNDIGDLRKYKSLKEVLAALVEVRRQSDDVDRKDEADHRPEPKLTALALWGFSRDMKIEDTIVARGGTREILGVGRVIGDYRYDDSRGDHWHTRTVEWTLYDEPPVYMRPGVARKTLTNYTGNKVLVHSMFEDIDQATPVPPDYTRDDALAELFIDDDRFDRISNALKLRKNLILQGPPGTGKTFMARRLAWWLIRRRESISVEMVQFHQSYAYEDFVQGYRPTESGGFALRNGVFYDFCKRARQDQGRPYVFIIDEINRGNMSRIFGELLMLIEGDKRNIQYATSLTYGKPGERFFVPPNVHILGMMNTADRSLAVVDYALRRRFAFEDLVPAFDSPKFRKVLADNKVPSATIDVIQGRMTALNERIHDDAELGPGFEIGHSYFVPGSSKEVVEKGESHDWYADIVETQIVPLLKEYWFDNPKTAKEAIGELRGGSTEEPSA